MNRKIFFFKVLAVVFGAIIYLGGNAYARQALSENINVNDLPVLSQGLGKQISYLYTDMTFDRLHNIVGGNKDGLVIDLKNPNLSGKIYVSQHPFEAGDSKYDYDYFADKNADISKGRGVIPISHFYTKKFDANSWASGGVSTATPTVAYRLELSESGKGRYGTFGGVVSFRKTKEGVFEKLPTIVDGPYVTMITSDDPSVMEIVWETDEPCSGEVRFGRKKYIQENAPGKKHSVKITNLRPGTKYVYYVRSVARDGKEVVSNTYETRSAPAKSKDDVVFAFSSDSRSSGGGSGFGERDYMGYNLNVLKQIMSGAYSRGAEFLLFGGDLVMGMTTSTEDLKLQYKGWKQAMAGFWRTRPVYSGMGNHEFGWNMFGDFMGAMDKWPYDTDSGEAVFAEEMYNPKNGPAVSDPRRPTYKENVYSFQYGPALIISFNNTYWHSYKPTKAGGSPTGYIMEDQLKWIEDTISKAENDSTVKAVFVFGHSPVFPSMKHVVASMFHGGNNKIRAFSKNSRTGRLEPEKTGVIEVRNRFWKAVSQSSKVAAVFTGDEHAYHRTLIDKNTPVGLYPEDDTNGDGTLDRYSPNPDFSHGVWHITCGGGGAPYVANVESDKAPWKLSRITSHYGYLLIRVSGGKATLEYIGGPAGEVLDKVDDLMSIK